MTFGKTFGHEIIAAGLGGLPLSWTPDGEILGREKLTQQQDAVLDAVIAAHDPMAEIVPDSVSPMALRLALSRAGKLKAVSAAVAALGAEAAIAWDYATRIDRAHPLVLGVAAKAKLTAAGLDGLFRAAAKADPK